MHKVIIDTDLGVDDAWAVLLALVSDDLDILGITTVFGNIEAQQAAENVLHVLELIGRQSIPVWMGSERPLLPILDAETGAPLSASFRGKEIHGSNGLGSYKIPQLKMSYQRNAIKWLADIVGQSEGDIEVVALGPLTNIALATLIEPDFVKKVKRLVFMGGVTDGPGNVLPLSTANIWNDPEAALIVFHAGFKEIVMVGQDVTRYFRITEKHESWLKRMSNNYCDFLLAISDIYASEYAKNEPDWHGYPLHDLLAICYVIDQDAFRTEELYVTVETKGLATRGQTVADRRQRSRYIRQMKVCIKVDLERVFEILFRRIGRVNV